MTVNVRNADIRGRHEVVTEKKHILPIASMSYVDRSVVLHVKAAYNRFSLHQLA